MMHSGGLRTGIDIGSECNDTTHTKTLLSSLLDITYSEIESVLPFNNTIDIAEIKGQHLKEILEFSVADANINLLQVSGTFSSSNTYCMINDRF
jgi:2',3'-cyclic-nucleotide 2'-phosphodiesterase (5'-nucleotidase family)